MNSKYFQLSDPKLDSPLLLLPAHTEERERIDNK